MICKKCGHDNTEEAQSVDPWCRYQVRDGVMIDKLFLPHLIPEGWYDSPGAAKAAFEPKVTIISAEATLESPLKKVDGRTKAAKQAKLDVNSSGSD